jgi:hypothetical protein
LVVAALSLLENAETDAISSARIALGVTVFAEGVAIRLYGAFAHHARLARYQPDDVRVILERFLAFGYLRSTGLVLEGVGLALALSSVSGVVVSIFVIPLWLAALRQMRVMGTNSLRRERPFDGIAPPPITIAVIAVIAAGLYVTAAIISGEIRIFASGSEAARTIALALAAGQGGTAVLALTVWFVVVQVVSSAYGVQLAFRGLPWRIVLMLVFIGTSVSFDLLIAARSDQWFGSTSGEEAMLVDLAILWAATGILFAGYSIMTSAGSAQPEATMADLVRRLDHRWLAAITEEFSDSFGPRRRIHDDPARAIEVLIRSLVDKLDSQSVRVALVELHRRIEKIRDGRVLIPVDRYLHYHLAGLIAYSEATPHVLEQFGEFARYLPLPDAETVLSEGLMIAETPPGELVLREVLDVAIQSGSARTAGPLISRIQSRGREMLQVLPPQDQTMIHNPAYDYKRERTEEEQRPIWENDWKIQGVESQYIDYLGEIGKAAIVRCPGAVFTCSMALSQEILAIAQLADRPAIRRILLIGALRSMEEMSQALPENRPASEFSMSMLHYFAERLDSADSDRILVAEFTATVAARILDRLARKGSITAMQVIDVAMVGVYGGRVSSVAAVKVIDGLGTAHAALSGKNHREDYPFIQQEMRNRIRQLGREHGNSVLSSAEGQLQKMGYSMAFE